MLTKITTPRILKLFFWKMSDFEKTFDNQTFTIRILLLRKNDNYWIFSFFQNNVKIIKKISELEGFQVKFLQQVRFWNEILQKVRFWVKMFEKSQMLN